MYACSRVNWNRAILWYLLWKSAILRDCIKRCPPYVKWTGYIWWKPIIVWVWVYWCLRYMQRYFSHICDGANVQADWRRSCTYGRAPNAIDISQGSLTCPSYTDTGPPFLYGDSDTPPHLVAFYDTLGIRRTYSRLKPLASSRGNRLTKTSKMSHIPKDDDIWWSRNQLTRKVRKIWTISLKYIRIQTSMQEIRFWLKKNSHHHQMILFGGRYWTVLNADLWCIDLTWIK